MKNPKPTPKPTAWWRNSSCYIGFLCLLIAIAGLPFLGGDRAIRDPGQVREDHLWLLYLGAAAVMLVNGYLLYRMQLRAYEEENDL